jgi:hypothetical protein
MEGKVVRVAMGAIGGVGTKSLVWPDGWITVTILTK